MKKHMKLYSVLFLITALVFIYQGCSELEDDILAPSRSSGECTLCHGRGDNPNPPKALNGDTSRSNPGVGAHVQHLMATRFSAKVECGECHIPVNNYWDSTHIDRTNPDNRAEITFGPLAKQRIYGGYIPNPQYDANDRSCADVYCHGGFAGGNQMTVKWMEPENVICGSCHGNPVTGNPNPKPFPLYTHDPNNTITTCVDCHRVVMDSSGTFKRTDLHVNGVVNFGQNP